jgi:glutamate racemase
MNMEKGTIGIFDSGLGGLLLLSSIRASLPHYDYVFFGDQAYVPYGNKTKDELLERAKKVFTFLFEEHKCKIIFLACNTTSTNIIEELKVWVAAKYPDRRIWGIVRPTIEAIDPKSPAVFFGTHRTISSHEYKKKMAEQGQDDVVEIEMPNLASLIEEGKETSSYIESFKNQVEEKPYTGVLVCTHYGLVRNDFKKSFPFIQKWVYQEDIMPPYLQKYFSENLHWENQLSNNGTVKILVSALHPTFNSFSKKWFGQEPENVSI